MTEQPDPEGERTEPDPAAGSTTTSSPEESAAAGGENDSPPAQGEGEQNSW